MTRPFRCVRSSQRRKRLLNVDLNAMPPRENLNQEGTSSRVVSPDETPVPRVTLTSQPIDVEGLDDDDDVIILSPRAFAEGKNNPRRNRGGAIVVDVDSEERPCRVASTNTYKRRSLTNQPVMYSQMCINLDGYNNSQGKNDGSLMLVPAPPPLPPKEAVFNCPVCMGPLVEEMSTKCGHIFCKVCIKASIDAQGKCPTCRRKITMKNTIRVYLPSTS
ncbi:unnamed protein product [Cuscuta campestris]|uniref:RING-type domain-containing protein n=1 Tax=Cuscuta campestris TaxID=132261 RepID=A0A484NL21_9ASTE|nr:unnamed protein product [Cuscuta campestris]